VRSLNVVLVLPLAFRLFTTEEFVAWQALATLISTQLLFDLGLTPTFCRLIGYAMGGAGHESTQPNWTGVGENWSTLLWIYRRLILVAFVCLATLGTLSLLKPLSGISNPTMGWLAWAVVLVTTPLSFASLPYAAYLQGINEIALLRRSETFIACGAVLSNLLALAVGGGFLTLLVSTQFWALINVWQTRRLAAAALGGKLKTFPQGKFVPEVFRVAWPAAWRSGAGVLLTAGFVQVTALIYAQLGSTLEVAAYFLALRLISAINQFSQAPFYSKLALLAQLQAQGRTADLVNFAQRGMRFALWAYVLGTSVVAFSIEPALHYLGRSMVPLDPVLWWLLAGAFLADLFSSMHLHLYSVTNDIIWHRVNGVSGTLCIVALLLAYPLLGIYALPVSLLVGYAGFSSWYCARKVYLAFQVSCFDFEKTVGFAAGLGFCAAMGLQAIERLIVP
jgi:hypothetical protein